MSQRPPTVRFEPELDISTIRGAEYNPRRLSEEAFERLKASLSRFGVVKPIIVNGNGTIVAGHQRTKALTALGVTHVAAMVLDREARQQDEINFNLLHNRVETESSVVYVKNPGPVGQWCWTPWEDLVIEEELNAAFVAETMQMVGSYGPWGSIVCDDNGRIFLNAEYAVVAAHTRNDVLTWVCDQGEALEMLGALTGEYGVYDWTNVGGLAPVWNQHAVQPKRLRKIKEGKKAGETHYKSHLWETRVLPWLTKEHRVIDFGAGYGDYVKMLRPKGYQVFDYEPFRVTQGAYKLDMAGIVGMIHDIRRDVAQHGLFDVVVNDSVLNATSTKDFQHAVLTTLNALLAPDGTLALGTRGVTALNSTEDAKSAHQTGNRRVNFLDDDNVEMSLAQNKWVVMRFHSADSLRALLEQYFVSVDIYDPKNATITAVCSGPKKLDPDEVRRCLDLEFNMPYPNDYRHNKQGPLVELLMREYVKRP